MLLVDTPFEKELERAVRYLAEAGISDYTLLLVFQQPDRPLKLDGTKMLMYISDYLRHHKGGPKEARLYADRLLEQVRGSLTEQPVDIPDP